MQTERLNNLKEDLVKQINLNFSEDEIRQNLLDKGYTIDEIIDARREINIKEKPKSQYGFLSILVSIFFIIRGMMYVGQDRMVLWGIILIIGGIVGLIIKISNR